MNPLILFTKFFKDYDAARLVALAKELGIDGYDLCVRPGYPVNPDNVSVALPDAVRQLRANGFDVPMVTTSTDLSSPTHPSVEPMLAAMDRADVRFVKIGYFFFDAAKQDYWAEVDLIRTALSAWAKLGERHRVKVCYHTHSRGLMGLNAGTLMHLLHGFDPQWIGACLDPGHLAVEGEEFDVALAIVGNYLSLVALKDVLLKREQTGDHGRAGIEWVVAGEGMVDWTAVFAGLARRKYGGPLTMHCEFEVKPEEFLPAVKREVRFFRAKLRTE